MTILLLLLMAYQIVGEMLHEWFGAGMLVLFIVHTVLNIKWYKNLFKEKYKPVRIFGTILNFAVLASILSLGYSGIVMSRHLFAFLPINRGMALARVMHLAGSRVHMIGIDHNQTAAAVDNLAFVTKTTALVAVFDDPNFGSRHIEILHIVQFRTKHGHDAALSELNVQNKLFI